VVQLVRTIVPDDHIPGLEVLHRDAIRVKFNRNKIVSCKAVDRYKILNDIRRNQNIIKIVGMIERRKVSMSSGGNRKPRPIIDDGALRGGGVE
jgi:hypothetical protein